MKKYLLLILTMLSVSIGAWAAATVSDTRVWHSSKSGNYYDGDAITIHSDGAGTIKAFLENPGNYNSYRNKIFVTGEVNANDITAIYTAFPSANFVDYSYATLASGTTITNVTTGVPSQYKGLGLPAGYNSELTADGTGLKYVWSATWSGTYTDATSTTSRTIYINFLSTGAATDFASTVNLNGASVYVQGNTTMYAQGEMSSAERSNYSEGLGSFSYASAIMTDGCKVTIDMSLGSGTLAERIANAKTAVTTAGEEGICKLTVKGEINNSDLEAIGGSDMSGATRIDLSAATVATGSDIANLTVPSSLTQLVLPSSINSKTFAIPATLNTRLAALSNLEYAYVPTSETQNADQKVADYVYVYKSGGLKTAFETESKLCTGVYIKVGSTAELSTLDMNFNEFSSKPTAYEFLDLSAANLRPLGARDYYCTTTSDYRIILPDNWRGDQMAVFSANANRGSCAAVYSYVGTELNILEIDDNNYRPGALAEERIVRSGTTAVNVIGGDYGENSYHSFGTRLLAAINNAASSITSVTIAVPDAPNELTFTNKNITTLNLKEVNNSSAVLNVDDASKLETLNLSGATISKATAQNITTLTTVDLTEATLAGTKNTENGEGCINLTGSLNAGLTITYVEGFDTDRILPAAARTAPYANPITLADIEVTCASGIESNLQAALDAIGTGYTPRDVTVLHVTSALTADDISYIMSHMPRLRLLDLSGATYATGVKGEDVVDAMVAANKLETALVFPTNADENVNKHEVWYASQNNYMHCVGYFADATKKEMQLYGYDENVAKLATLFSSEQNQAISLLPAYKADPAVDMSKAMPADNALLYPSATNTFVSAGLSQLPAICIDFTWMNASTVKDMTGLNSATHFLVVAQNSNTAATTNDPTNTTAEGGYKYGSDVWAITSFKGTASPYSTTAYFGGRQFDFSATGINETAILAYITPNGVGKVNSTTATYVSTRLPEVDRYIAFGEYDEEAIKSLENIKAKKIDLSSVTVTDANLAKFKNNEVEYLALPDGKNSAIAATSADDFAFDTACPELKAIGAYDPTNLKYTVHSTDKTVNWTDESKTAFTDQENSVYVISSMCRPSSTRQTGKANGTTVVEMSGYLTLDDIQMNDGIATVTGQSGLNTNSSGSIVTADFSNAVFLNNEDMTFTGATWSGTLLTSIQLPTNKRQKRIPAQSMYNYTGLTEICIPYNYETIGTAAFYLANILHLTTTDANGAPIDNGVNTFTFSKNLKEIGDAPSSLTTGEGNAAYPTPLSEPVFFSDAYKALTDIYILRTGYEDGSFAPTKCYRNAFGAGPTYGWGGFDGGNLYCREKYKNGSQLFTVLHYPDMASLPKGKQTTNTELTGDYDVMEKAYTDPTRVYTKKDQTGALDANGELIPWPTHSEFGRAYNQAMRGLVWNDWDIDPEKQANGNINGGTITTPPSELTDVTPVSSPTRFDLAYTGWHEFVLAKATYVAPDQKVANDVVYQEYADAQYYTFCVPFDMTPAEVLSLLGVPASTDKVKTIVGTFTFNDEGNCTNIAAANEEELYPRIYTLKGVEREMKASSNNITLKLTKNLANLDGGVYKYWEPSTGDVADGSYESNAINYTVDEVAKSAAGNEVMIRGGYPYLIKAYLPKGTTVNNATLRGSLGKYVMSRYAFPMDASSAVRKRENCYIMLKGSSYYSAFARPYDQHLVRATFKGKNSNDVVAATTDDNKPYYYRFMAQYWDQYMPTHTYYLYYGDQKWYYNDNHENWAWRPYTCIINACSSSDYLADDDSATGSVIPVSTVNDSEGHSVFSENLKLLYSTTAINDTEFPDSNNARDYMFVFEDDDIMEVGENGSETTAIDRIDGVDIVPTNSNVYNMNGQLVGKSLNGLPKGMYIVNGKKIVIK